MEAALIRYYPSRILGELSEGLEASGLFYEGSSDITRRNRYTHVRRYRSLEQVRSPLCLVDVNADDDTDINNGDDEHSNASGVSGLLFELEAEQVLCVAVTDSNNRTGPPLLYRLKFNDIKFVTSSACLQAHLATSLSVTAGCTLEV